MDTSSPPSSWYDPPNYHEVDNCFVCHMTDEHRGKKEYWTKLKCWKCEEELEKGKDE